MDFKKLNINEIKPFLRLVVPSKGMHHADYVIPFEHRIIYCEQGEADLWIDGKYFSVKPNDIFYIAVGVPYKMEASNDTIVHYFCFDLTFENSAINQRMAPVSVSSSRFVNNLENMFYCNYHLYEEDEEIKHFYIPNAVLTCRRAKKLFEYYVDKVGGVYSDLMLSGMLTTLIAMMFFDRRNVFYSDSVDKVANKVFDYVRENFNRKISIEDIAEKINYHKSYLNRCVKKKTGLSLYRYLLNYRLDKAMEILMYTGATVTEVAEKVGFTNAKGFTTAFKDYHGISPSGVKKYKA